MTKKMMRSSLARAREHGGEERMRREPLKQLDLRSVYVVILIVLIAVGVLVWIASLPLFT
jgi:cell division septal protein FtsQ